jgi:hypothetical protein
MDLSTGIESPPASNKDLQKIPKWEINFPFILEFTMKIEIDYILRQPNLPHRNKN